MAASRIGRSFAMSCTSFGKATVAGASSAISICWSNRYSRVRLSAASRLRSASWIAYAELTNVTSRRLHSVSAGDISERHAAENKMLASRNARSVVSVSVARRVESHQGRGPVLGPLGARPDIRRSLPRCSEGTPPCARPCSVRRPGASPKRAPTVASLTHDAFAGSVNW